MARVIWDSLESDGHQMLFTGVTTPHLVVKSRWAAPEVVITRR